MAEHLAVARWQREDVQTCGGGWHVAELLDRFTELNRRAQARTRKCLPIIVIQEEGLDGFWIHRVLQAEGIESYVVDPASIAISSSRMVLTNWLGAALISGSLGPSLCHPPTLHQR